MLLSLVVDRRVRPPRPPQEDAHIMDDATWNIIKHCWTHEGSDRPAAREVAMKLQEINSLRSSPVVLVSGQADDLVVNTNLQVGGSSLQTPPVTPPARFTRPKPLDLSAGGEVDWGSRWRQPQYKSHHGMLLYLHFQV